MINGLNPKRHFLLKNTVSRWWNPKYERYSQEIMNIIKPIEQGLCLEVGSGDGRYTIPLAQYGNLTIGVDLSNEMIERCMKRIEQAKNKNIMLIQADAEHLPFKNETFKKVVCIATLVHIPNYENTVNEYFRVTQNNGCIITENISLLHPTILYYWLKNKIVRILFKENKLKLIPYYPRTPWKIKNAFQKREFKIEEICGFYIILPLIIVKHINLFAYNLKSSKLKYFGSGLVVRAKKTINHAIEQ